MKLKNNKINPDFHNSLTTQQQVKVVLPTTINPLLLLGSSIKSNHRHPSSVSQYSTRETTKLLIYRQRKQNRRVVMNPNPLSEPYYLLHFLTFFSYLITRTSATSLLSPHLIHRLFYRVLYTISLSLYYYFLFYYIAAFGLVKLTVFIYLFICVCRRFKRFWRLPCQLPIR